MATVSCSVETYQGSTMQETWGRSFFVSANETVPQCQRSDPEVPALQIYSSTVWSDSEVPELQN